MEFCCNELVGPDDIICTEITGVTPSDVDKNCFEENSGASPYREDV